MAVIKAVFSASLRQSSVSHDLQKSSAAQETFMIIISVENSWAASYFGENHIIISSEEQHVALCLDTFLLLFSVF